jgi:hypothetical protein
VNQRHSCGTGSTQRLLAGKPPALVRIFRRLAEALRAMGGVEVVAKDRYALFRTTRVIADAVFMKDALRLAIVLGRRVDDPAFFKVQSVGPGRIGHVTKLRTLADLQAVAKYLDEARSFSVEEASRA